MHCSELRQLPRRPLPPSPFRPPCSQCAGPAVAELDAVRRRSRILKLNVMKSLLLIFCFVSITTSFCADDAQGWPAANPVLPGSIPGRSLPVLSAEQAIDLARKAVVKQGTKLNKRFLASATYIADQHKVPELVREFATGPHWLITYEDPEYRDDTRSPNYRIFVLVFSNNHVAIIAPE